jgi:hypothetical protein
MENFCQWKTYSSPFQLSRILMTNVKAAAYG